MAQSRSPTLSEVLRVALDARLADLHVSLPGRVERYDPKTKLADVKPLLKSTVIDDEDNEQKVSLPVIPNVPVVFQGAGGFRVTFPVQPGDTVLLVFAERSIDRWISQGGEVDPVDLRQHALADAIAVPGLNDVPRAWSDAGTHMTAGKDGGPQIHFKENLIELGAEGGEGVALGNTLSQFLAKLILWLNAHTHPVSGTLAGKSLPPIDPAPNVASSTVKTSS